MFRISSSLLVIFLLAAAATAQIPTEGNYFFGVTPTSAPTRVFGDRANLNGWNGSLEGKSTVCGELLGRSQRSLRAHRIFRFPAAALAELARSM